MCSSYCRYQSKQFVLKDTILETQKAKNKELERKGRVQYNKVSKGELFQKCVLNLKSAAAKAEVIISERGYQYDISWTLKRGKF